MTAELFLVTVSMGMKMNQRQKKLLNFSLRVAEGHSIFKGLWLFTAFMFRGDEKISNINLFHWRTLPNHMYENPAIIQGDLMSFLPVQSPGCEWLVNTIIFNLTGIVLKFCHSVAF